jgi:hypothetical protein
MARGLAFSPIDGPLRSTVAVGQRNIVYKQQRERQTVESQPMHGPPAHTFRLRQYALPLQTLVRMRSVWNIPRHFHKPSPGGRNGNGAQKRSFVQGCTKWSSI